MAERLFTIGHSTRTSAELIDMLRAYRIRVLVDVRTIPRSRTNPQFNPDAFAGELAKHRIRYVHLASLGGLRKKAPVQTDDNAAWRVSSFRNYADYAETPEFAAGLEELLRLGARSRTVIMCAEAVFWRCHRRIIADHLLARGVHVTHIVSRTHADEATLTPFAHVRGKSVTYPPSVERMGQLAEHPA